MKKNIALFTLFVVVTFAVTGQNAHWEYQFTSSGNPITPTSAVTVANSSGKIYLFQTDPNGIYVSLLNPANMLPTATDYEYLWPGFNIVLEGGYRDSNNIVVYGSMGNYPIVWLYNTSNQAFTDIFWDGAHPNDYFINGCSGSDINGNRINALVLEKAGQLICVDWNYESIDSLRILNFNGKISDVVWDASHQCFAVAGSQESGYEQLFLLEVQYNINSGFQVQHSLAWNLADPSYSYGEYRTCLEIISDSEIIVGHCVRDQLNTQTDGVWLSVVQNYSLVTNSVFFDMPSPKLHLLDMIFEDSRNQLMLLCEMNHFCGRVNILAQVNPFSLSGMTAVEVVDNTSTGTPCTYNQNSLYFNDIFLQKLELNNLPWLCAKILACGTYNGGFNGPEAFVTETYDIANSQCDPIFVPGDTTVPHSNGSVYFTTAYYFPGNYIQGPFALSFSGPLYENLPCPDLIYCSKDILENPKRLTKADDSTPELDFGIDGILVLHGFTGDILYNVYNSLGQLVLSGHTFNENLWLDLPKAGFYVVKAEDKSGNVATKKIIVTR